MRLPWVDTEYGDACAGTATHIYVLVASTEAGRWNVIRLTKDPKLIAESPNYDKYGYPTGGTGWQINEPVEEFIGMARSLELAKAIAEEDAGALL